jgi:hypothetical protein
MTRHIVITTRCLLAGAGALYLAYGQADSRPTALPSAPLRAEQDDQSQTIKVYLANEKVPILTENARQDGRPYLDPIVAPDGNGVITEYRPAHHLHQAGIYWGFKLVNGREFFMQCQADHYRKCPRK